MSRKPMVRCDHAEALVCPHECRHLLKHTPVRVEGDVKCTEKGLCLNRGYDTQCVCVEKEDAK